MNQAEASLPQRAQVIVSFRTSSTKAGPPAYEVTTTSDATEAQVDNAVAMAGTRSLQFLQASADFMQELQATVRESTQSL